MRSRPPLFCPSGPPGSPSGLVGGALYLKVEAKSTSLYAARELDKDWRRHNSSICRKHGITDDYDGWSKRPDVLLSGVPRLPRVVQAIDSFWGIKAKMASKSIRAVGSAELKRNLWLDISQQVHRLHSGAPGVLCTSGLWYSFEHDQCLDGEDVMTLQGFPRAVASDTDFTSSEKRRLAGEAFHLGSFGIVAYAWYVNPWGRWWKS
jgi:hypothetical protein